MPFRNKMMLLCNIIYFFFLNWKDPLPPFGGSKVDIYFEYSEERDC